MVIADQKHHRLIACTLRDPRAVKLIQHLLRSDFSEVLLDSEAAAKFSVGSSTVDSMIRVDLPAELAGPILPVDAELVFELRPRLGAGLRIALMMHEERFRELLVPGQKPDTVSCLLESGPVRLQRDLDGERQRVQQVVENLVCRIFRVMVFTAG